MSKVYFILLLFVFFSCKKQINEQNPDIAFADSTRKIDHYQATTDCDIIDSITMQTSDYQGIKFYTENMLRGKGVMQIIIDRNLEILNLDKTSFGKISLLHNDFGDSYELNFPKIVIAREIIPNDEYSVFSFDSELPESDKNFLVIYINKEKKLIKKSDIKYKFLDWNNYIKSAYIQLNENDKYMYKVLEIKEDSLKIKSISKTDCDYVQSYKNITKWIKWKNNNCKLIKINFCY